MNYEQLIKSRDENIRVLAHLPIGDLYRQQVEGKYTNVLHVRTDMTDNLFFSSDITFEIAKLGQSAKDYHIQCSPMMSDNKIVAVKYEQCKLQSLEQLLIENPAVLAVPGFIDGLLDSLFSAVQDLHYNEMLQVCLAPDSVLVKQNTSSVCLLTHGSNYMNIQNKKLLYKGFEDFVAPEVMEGSDPSVASDVYAMGKLLERIFEATTLPLEVQKAITKATNEDPSERYLSLEEMRSDMKRRKAVRRTVTAVIAAVLLVLVILVGMSSLFEPQTEMEYVKPAPKHTTDDLVERGIDPVEELGIIAGDDEMEMTEEERQQQEEFQKKAEEIFRRRYRQAAIRLLGKVYDKNNMSQPQNDFVSANQKALEELARLQTQYGSEAGLDDSKSQDIASQLIEEISNSLK